MGKGGEIKPERRSLKAEEKGLRRKLGKRRKKKKEGKKLPHRS